MSTPVATLTGFGYHYPGAAAAALTGIDLELAPGELVVLAGRSGSGKSTLLRALCGLVPHYYGGDVEGELEVCGLDLRESGPAELGAFVGLVAQDPETQVVSTTVRGELELPLELRGDPSAARARAVEEVALALGIAALLDRPTDTLSGGELQRVALAAALVLRPRLVLLDEPTSQLDPIAGDELIGLLRRLNEEWGTAVVLAEHRLERCLAAADRVVALAGARRAFDGSPCEFGEWAAAADGSLLTPAMRLFALAGVRPFPVAAKDARRILAAQGRQPWAASTESADRAGEASRTRRPASEVGAVRRRRELWRRADRGMALTARDLWVELDSGGGRRDVLRGVELAVGSGERVALMGANGAGKSTLLRTAAGLIAPARGRIEAPAGCALLPQSPGDLFLRERIADELPGEPGERALAAVGLEGVEERDPRDLSGGERERLALALVMAGRERAGVICLDEPTRGMDGARKAKLASWLGELAEAGGAVVCATHDVEFASRFAERVVLLAAGEVIADGPVDEILAGGWYFATEVARVLGAAGAITPEQGARVLGAAEAPEAAAATVVREGSR